MASYTCTPAPDQGAKTSVLAYLFTTVAVLLPMMVFGLLMRMEQAQFISMGASWFYELMTLHGAGMVAIKQLLPPSNQRERDEELQQFKTEEALLDMEYVNEKPYYTHDMEEFKKIFLKHCEIVEVR